MPVLAPPEESATRPLVVTADEHLLDEVIRLAAACDTALDVAPDIGAARQTWPRAPLVLVGADLITSLLRAGRPPRRNGAGAVVAIATSTHPFDWPGALQLGVDEVVLLPDNEPRLAELLSEAAHGAPQEAATIGIVGGRGGAGASVLAVALAVTAVKQRSRCALIDADRLGGGLDAILGAEEQEGARWPDLAGAEGRVSAAALRSALPCVGGLHVLSWHRGDARPVPPPAMSAVLDAAARLAELVVVDLPRHLDDASAAALAACTHTLLVVPAEVRAVTSAAQVASAISAYTADLRLVVRGPSPAGLNGHSIADALGLPLAGELAAERGLAKTLERGSLPGRSARSPLARWCRRFLSDLDLPQSEAA